MQAPHGPRAPVFVEPPSRRALAQHLTMRLVHDRTLTPSVEERRAIARAILSVGAGELGLLAFGIADTHLHVLTTARPGASIELARRIKISMQRRLSLGSSFEPTRLRGVDDVHHLTNVLAYVVSQPSKHARRLDPCFEGSSLLELLGMRVVDEGGLARAVLTAAPRLDVAGLAALLRVELGDAMDFDLLADATRAAFALASLDGPSDLAVRAKRAAVHAAADLATGEIAALLGVCRSTVKATRHANVARADVAAVRLQLRLRTALRAQEP